MLSHGLATPQPPGRIVILGAGGFIGGAIAQLAQSIGLETLTLTRAEVDLLAPGASQTLSGLLRASDSLVAASAIAPVKNAAMLSDNIRLIETIAAALRAQPVAHLLNIGSDAIYADSDAPMTEHASREPTSLHGVMHYARELLLSDAAGEAPFATLRPTLVYGADDPHSGYGPNRFRREAKATGVIKLFGHGEERRDHVDIVNVAELALRILLQRSQGALNAATGAVVSFKDIAEIVAAQYGARIENLPRNGPMPHNGYRAFDAAATREAFPDFEYRPVKDGLARIHQALEA